jgi:hypothetical protein
MPYLPASFGRDYERESLGRLFGTHCNGNGRLSSTCVWTGAIIRVWSDGMMVEKNGTGSV